MLLAARRSSRRSHPRIAQQADHRSLSTRLLRSPWQTWRFAPGPAAQSQTRGGRRTRTSSRYPEGYVARKIVAAVNRLSALGACILQCARAAPYTPSEGWDEAERTAPRRRNDGACMVANPPPHCGRCGCGAGRAQLSGITTEWPYVVVGDRLGAAPWWALFGYGSFSYLQARAGHRTLRGSSLLQPTRLADDLRGDPLPGMLGPFAGFGLIRHSISSRPILCPRHAQLEAMTPPAEKRSDRTIPAVPGQWSR